MRPNLKRARREKVLTQKQVADVLGVSLRMYVAIEGNTRTGNVRIWDKLQDLLDLDQRILRATETPNNCTTESELEKETAA